MKNKNIFASRNKAGRGAMGIARNKKIRRCNNHYGYLRWNDESKRFSVPTTGSRRWPDLVGSNT